MAQGTGIEHRKDIGMLVTAAIMAAAQAATLGGRKDISGRIWRRHGYLIDPHEIARKSGLM